MTEICWLLLSNNWCSAKTSWIWICWISRSHSLRVKRLTVPALFGPVEVHLFIQDLVLDKTWRVMDCYLCCLMSVCDKFGYTTLPKKKERSSGSFLRKAISSLKEETLFDIWYPGVLNVSPTLQHKGLQYFLTQRHLESFQWGLAFVSKYLYIHC